MIQAQEDLTVALKELHEIEMSMGSATNNHSTWVQVIGQCISTARRVAEEMKFSILTPISGSLEISSPQSGGEQINRLLGSRIQCLHDKIHSRAIHCAEKLSPLFSTQNVVELEGVFCSTGSLIRNCYLLLESELKLAEDGQLVAVLSPIDMLFVNFFLIQALHKISSFNSFIGSRCVWFVQSDCSVMSFLFFHVNSMSMLPWSLHGCLCLDG